MFLFDSLNGFIDSPESLSLIGFKTSNSCLRKSNLFHIPFYHRRVDFIKTTTVPHLFSPRALA